MKLERKYVLASLYSSTDLLKSQRIFYAAKYPLEMLPVKKRQQATDCDEKRGISGKK